MSPQRGTLPTTLPTLTEVIEILVDPSRVEPGPHALAPESMPIELLPLAQVEVHAALTSQVLDTLRPRVNALLEARLRSAFASHAPRLSDEAIQRIRSDLAAAMQVLVAQTIDEVLARRRKP